MDWSNSKNKNRKRINYIYPIVLFLYPFLNVNEGVDWMDVGYNLGNFAFWDKLGNTWKLSTYLSNVLGRFFYKLPGGDTLLGMNCYTTLLISALALIGYWFTKKYVPVWIAFWGNVLAISLCWCPTTKLYDYLTYLLLMIGIVFLFQGLVEEKRKFLIIAGFFLGMNVFTRLPNLVEAGFILLVWYDSFLKKKTWKEALFLTGWCMLGYLSAIMLFFLIVCASFGLSSYFAMLGGISEIESSTNNYSFLDLLTGAWKDYLRSFKWIVFYLGYILAGEIVFRRSNKIEVLVKFQKWLKIFYLLGMIVLYRFFWGRGMFDLNYYSYGVIFWPTAIFLVWSIGLCLYRFSRSAKQYSETQRLLTMLVFLIILITPLGSNNKIYPIMNSLFLVAPFIIVWSWEVVSKCSYSVQATIGVFALFFAIQSFGFGITFTFGDGSYDEKRDTKIENNGILYGMYTSSKKAQTVEGLTAYVDQQGNLRSVLTYGNIPSMSYYLELEPALGSSWPDLESFSIHDYQSDLTKVEIDIDADRPVILINANLDEEDKGKTKYQILLQFMERCDYQLQLAVDDVLLYY